MRTALTRTNNSLNRAAPQIFAGALAVIITTMAAFSISSNFGVIPQNFITNKVNAATDYIKNYSLTSKSEPQPEIEVSVINNGTLMLYTPEPTQHKGADKEPADTESPSFEFEPEPEPVIPVLSRNISIEQEDLTVFSAQDGSVIKRTYRPKLGENYIQLPGGGQVRNETQIADDILLHESRLQPKFKTEKGVEPQVLIMHSHTTESFRLSDDGSYDFNYTFRTLDSRKNIVAVGAKIAEEIAKEGFAVIHDGTVHDNPVYSGSYKRSAETVQAILEEYPSIKVVLDIHRDAIESDSGAPVAAVADINGRQAAQIMIIAPAEDDGEWGVPDFMQNFRFASNLQSRIEADNPGLTRALLFQYCNYNMHLSTGALLIEVGSHGNTLEQALYASELLGKSIAGVLSELEG